MSVYEVASPPGASRRIRRAALAGLSLVALGVAAPTQGLAQGATQLEEISVQGGRSGREGGAGTGAGADSAAAPSATVGGGLNTPAGAVGTPPGQESPVGPIRGYVATRSETATKTNTPLLETPQSISVIGTTQIAETGAQTLSEATAYTAGIYANAFGADARVDFFTLRGFVASDYGIYKDSLQLLNYGFGTLQTEIFGLERIEVLRGPAALLFGAGNPGGLVNQITKRPTTLPFGYVEVGGGSFGQVYGAFDVGGPVDESRHWFYRVTGILRGGGTQVEGAPYDRAYIAPAFTYTPDAGTALTVLTSYQRDSTAVTANFLPYYGTVRPNASGLRIDRSLNVGDPNINTFQREQAYAGYEFVHAFDETWTIRQNLRYSFSDATQNSYIGQIGYADAAQTQLGRYQFNYSDRVNLFQVDTRGEAVFSDGLFRHNVILGVDYKNYALHDNQGTNFAASPFYAVPPLNIVTPNYGPPLGRPGPYQVLVYPFTQLGLYAQDQINLTDRLILIGGLREDIATSDVDVKFTNGSLVSSNQNTHALTGRVGLLYNFDPGIAPYVAYSTSFQPQVGVDVVTGQLQTPDKGEQVEVGLKVQPIGENYFLTVAAFDLVRDNPPINLALPFAFGTTQLGSVRSRGFEAQFNATLAEGLNVVAAFTTYDLEFLKVNDARLNFLVGKTPTNTPQTFASVFADYTIPVGDLRGFGFGGGVRYVGSSYANLDNSLRVPQYVLFDATVHYNWDGWRAAITAANIGDRRFVSSCQSENSCFYGEARRVIASLSYKW